MKTSHRPQDDVQDAAHWDAVEEATELLLQGNPHDALHLLRDIVREDPRNPYAYYYMGTAMFEVGRFDAAADAYRAGLRISPTYLAARVGLSHSLRIEGQLDEAIRQARRVLDQVPGDGDALFALGLALASNNDRVGAVRALEAFLQTHPELEVTLEARAMLEKLGPIEQDEN